MIRKIEFKNFYSFRKPQIIDLRVCDNKIVSKLTKSEINFRFFKDIDGTLVSKIACFFGANASGKTNITRIFSFLKWLVIDSASNETSNLSHYLPFKFSKDADTESYFKLEFSAGDNIYEYEIKITNRRINEERLRLLNSNEGVYVFERKDYFVEKLEYKQSFNTKIAIQSSFFGEGEVKTLLEDKLKNIITKSKSILGWLLVFFSSTKETQEIKAFFNDFQFLGRDFGLSEQEINNKAIQIYSNDEIQKKASLAYLSKFDTGVTNFRIEDPRDDNDKNPLRIYFEHGNEENTLNYLLESSGTRNLFNCIPLILDSFTKKSVLISDEFDNYLHQNVVEKLLSDFQSNKINPHSQVFMTVHTTSALNILHKKAIFLVEKNDQESCIYSLYDFKGSRTQNALNIEKKYRAGFYGATPNILL